MVDKFGSIKIYFNDNYILDVIPDNSTDAEAWRFFKRECEEGHLVMTGVGIDLEELNS